MLKRIDHIGVLVKDIEEAAELFCGVFGFKKARDSPYMDPRGEFKSIFIVAGDVTIELIAPIASGALARFLEKRGEGLHHISIEVDDISQEIESLKAKGVRLRNEKAQLVGNNRIVFIHPAATRGVLVELTEKVSGQHSAVSVKHSD